jgi:D-alanine-D-alanine ligase
MHRTRVGVLRGGPSPEFEVSLKTGDVVLRHLSEEKHHSTDIFIDRQRVWHIGGLPFDHAHVTKRFDVLFNALHGTYGEDGTLQGLLDGIGARYTGSGKLGSALAMNKAKAKEIFKKAGIRTASHATLHPEGDMFELVRDGKREEYDMGDLHRLSKELFLTFPQPAVVKPLASGSSVGVRLVYGPKELEEAMEELLAEGTSIILEEFIKGEEATCGVVEGFRGENLYALPPIEIVPPKESKFFDYDAKYGGETQEICPGRFSTPIKDALMDASKKAHEALGLSHYSRSDFIVKPSGSIYILETNTLPALTDQSLLPKSLAAVGANLGDFLDHLIELALKEKI